MRQKIDENILVRLVEKRGVAVSPWKKEIDNIAIYIRQFVSTYIKEKNRFDTIKFTIPQAYCTEFKFLNNPTVNITAVYYPSDAHYGSGNFGPHNQEGVNFENNSLNNVEINITCYYDTNGKVYLKTVLSTFYHEMNHAYDAWMNATKSANFARYNTSVVKGKYGDKVMNIYPTIGESIYRLLSETEYNALVASVFGDLQGMNSSFENFQNDYKKTGAYEVYKFIKENLGRELGCLTKDTADILYKNFKSRNISLNVKNNTLTSFRTALQDKVNKKLNDLLHDIGRVASYYYDVKSEEELNGPLITHIDEDVKDSNDRILNKIRGLIKKLG